MGAPRLLAGDWGTTNLRAWTLDEAGIVIQAARFDGFGVSHLAREEAASRFESEMRPALGAEGLPALLCGMVGSTLGWAPAPYEDCPAGLADLAARLTRAPGAARVSVVPGLRWRGAEGRPDVMRGEETQILGWAAADPQRSRGKRLVCHPGTHTKWVLLEEGRIAAFATAMTGELFAVLRAHSVLAGSGGKDDPAAFDAGLEAAGDGGALAARLFGVRARVVGYGAAQDTSGDYLSGLLIGADAAATPALLGVSVEAVDIIGDARLCALYARALERRGARCEIHDGETAAVTGLWALHRSAS
jgi:2-dehydro-3-deoxygalactonokinase